MSSPSVVRIAGPDDYSEVWRLLRQSHTESGLFSFSVRKVSALLNTVIDPRGLKSDRAGSLIGVIGPEHALEGLVLLVTGCFWYSEDQHLEEYMIYVDPPHRRSGHAKALVSWMKGRVEVTGLPLITGILSTHRTEAKVRLYERMLPKIGAFFYIAPKGSSMSPALSAASS